MKSTALFAIFTTFLLNSCASFYKTESPQNLSFPSKKELNQVVFEYKYDYLSSKYASKQYKKGVKVIALKITNNTDNDLVFNENLKLTYDNGNFVEVLNIEQVYSSLKQKSATYLLYLLLTPLRFETYETNAYGAQETTSSTPIGYVVGPGVAAGNIIVSSNANQKFKDDLKQNILNGKLIKKGETVYGLIGIKSTNFDNLTLQF